MDDGGWVVTEWVVRPPLCKPQNIPLNLVTPHLLFHSAWISCLWFVVVNIHNSSTHPNKCKYTHTGWHQTNGMYVAVGEVWIKGNSRYSSADNDIISVSRHVPLFLTLILNICRMCVTRGWLRYKICISRTIYSHSLSEKLKVNTLGSAEEQKWIWN